GISGGDADRGVDHRPRKQAQALEKGQAVPRSTLLDGRPVRQDRGETIAIELHPPTAHEHQRLGAGAQLAPLPDAQRFAVDREGHREIEQRIEAEPGRRPPADAYGHLRSRPRLPPVRYPHDDARRLERRYVAEEPVRLPWRPRQRLEDRTGLDELAQER